MSSYKVWVCVEDEDHGTDIDIDFPSTFETPRLDVAVNFAKYLHSIPWQVRFKSSQLHERGRRLTELAEAGELSYAEADERLQDLKDDAVEFIHELAGMFDEPALRKE